MLGWVLASFKLFTAFIAGVIGGAAVDRACAFEPQQRENIKIPEPKAPEKAILQILKYGFGTLFQDVAKPLLVGLLIAAAIATFIPTDSWFLQFKYSSWASILLMLMIGLPIYVCSTASVPIAAALILKGVSPGATLVFLIAGPAINIATITTMFKVVGRRGVAIYLATIAAVAVGAGILLDLCIAHVPKVLEEVMGAVKSGPDISIFNQICGVILLLLVLRVIISGEGKTEAAPEDFVIESVPADEDFPENTMEIIVPEMTSESPAPNRSGKC